MDKNLNDVCRSLKVADEIILTPTKELIDKVTLDPKFANVLLTQLDSDLVIVLACAQKLKEASKSLAKALGSLK